MNIVCAYIIKNKKQQWAETKQRPKEEVTITNPILDGYNNNAFKYEAGASKGAKGVRCGGLF